VQTDLPTQSPATFEKFAGMPLGQVDLLGRSKVGKGTPNSAFARIQRNAFKYKSLSSWAYNVAVGCRHACRFCYVPSSQQTGPGKKKENTGPLARTLREHGILDPDADWVDTFSSAHGTKRRSWLR
jgi:hypothetical protein